MDRSRWDASYAANAALADDLAARRARTARGGPDAARERHLERGKLLPRDRVETLLDEGTAFLEIAPLAADGMYDDEAPAAGVIAGLGYADPERMLCVGLAGVMIGDGLVFLAGRYYGERVMRWRWCQRA